MNANLKKPERADAHLSAPELCVLLFEDESQDGFHQAADHLEKCPRCQSELTALAGDADSWIETRSLLESEREPRWQPDLSVSHVSDIDPTFDRSSVEGHVLKLLGTPNHPEMLGRLGRYDIEKIIGSGGMGVVLKSHDSELNRPIAIKLLAPHLSYVAAARERFAREGRAAAAVVHEHVVAIYNVEADGAQPFLIMQYVPGRSLQARVDEDGPLSVEEILRIGLQAAAGLAAAHAQGLVHRDVKPSNILLEDTVERAVSAWPGQSTMRVSRKRGFWLAHLTTCRPSKRWARRLMPVPIYLASGPFCISWQQVIHRFARAARSPCCIVFARKSTGPFGSGTKRFRTNSPRSSIDYSRRSRAGDSRVPTKFVNNWPNC